MTAEVGARYLLIIGVRDGIFRPWVRWDRGLADFRRCSGDGVCVFCVFLRFWGRFGVVDLSGVKTEILRFRRNLASQEKSYVSGEILCFWDVLEL